MEFINLTSHDIDELSSARKFKVSGVVARVSTHEQIEVIDGIPVKRIIYGDIVGLPPKKDGIMYIVSAIVLNAVHDAGMDRDDLVSPSALIRGADRQPIGCNGFRRNG